MCACMRVCARERKGYGANFVPKLYKQILQTNTIFFAKEHSTRKQIESNLQIQKSV